MHYLSTSCVAAHRATTNKANNLGMDQGNALMAMDPKAPINDPHTHHQLIEGPTRLNIGQWMGVCKCNQEFRGLTAEDIYAKSQLHINRHNPEYGGAA